MGFKKAITPLLFSLLALMSGHSLKAQHPVFLSDHLWEIGRYPQSYQLPFRLAGKLIVVKAEIDGLKGNFILDTGAPALLLNTARLEKAGAPCVSNARGVTGKVNQVSLLEIRHFKSYQLDLYNIPAQSFDLSHLERARNIEVLGLIGYEVLKYFEVEVDYETQMVTLWRLHKTGKRIKASDTLPAYVHRFQLNGHVPVAAIRLGGKKLRFALDTGAEANLLDNDLDPATLETCFSVSRRVMMSGTGKARIEVLAGNMQHFSLGEINFKPMRALVSDLSYLNQAYSARLDGVLGYEFFRQRKISINYIQNKLKIW